MEAGSEPQKIDQESLVEAFRDVKSGMSKEFRFCFLIGAGASKSSGIQTGQELAKEWYRHVEKKITQDEKERWEKEVGAELSTETAGEFYSFLYGKRFGNAPQIGVDSLKKMMDGKEPSIGYVILAQILAAGQHNFVITTNFDYLIEDAIRMHSQTKPFIAGHEMLAEFVSMQTERPTIMKVHRDALLHPFNDCQNTGVLKDEWKNSLSSILKDYHLLVLGYGGNDLSLMNYLKSVPARDRKPIYWCVKQQDSINGKVKDLLQAKDFVVEINGFDELMYVLNDELEFNIFKDLDTPDKHPFVIAAKKRLEVLSESRKTLVWRLVRRRKDEDFKLLRGILDEALNCLLDILLEDEEDEKEELFEKAIKEYPDSEVLMMEYASFLAQKNRFQDACEKYAQAVTIKPDSFEVYNTWGVILGDLVRNKTGEEADDLCKEAFENYAKAITIKPDSFEAYNNWGVAFMNLATHKTGVESDGLYKEAFEKFAKALDLSPDSFEAYNNCGVVFMNLAMNKIGEEADDLYKEAFKNYAKALDLNPAYFDVYYNWAIAFMCLAMNKTGEESDGLYKKAFENYAKAITIKPNSFEAYNNWGVAFMNLATNKTGEEAATLYGEALEKFAKAIDLNPDSFDAYNNWGNVLGYLAMNKTGEEAKALYAEACEKYAKAVEINPGYFEAYYNWGNVLGCLAVNETGEEAATLYGNAFEKFAKAVEIKPDYFEAYNNWGNALGRLAMNETGEEAATLYGEAFDKYAKAVEINPDYFKAYNNWGYALGNLATNKTGEEAEALYGDACDKYARAAELGGSCYNLACLYALRADKENALRYLEKSLAGGEVTAELVMKDEDWAAYRADEDFLALMRRFEKKATV